MGKDVTPESLIDFVRNTQASYPAANPTTTQPAQQQAAGLVGGLVLLGGIAAYYSNAVMDYFYRKRSINPSPSF